MTKARTLAVIAAGMMMVSGCGISSEVEALQKMPTKGDAFMHALHMEYATLAGAADSRGSDDSAEHFYKKGTMAAGGKKVAPMGMKERKLPKRVSDEIEAGRLSLIAMLRGGGPKKAPNQSALAQASFDCWMEEAAQEKPNAKELKACRDTFDQALKRADDAINK